MAAEKNTAVQNAVNATAVLTQVANDYGIQSPEAADALDAALKAGATARQLGATDDEIRATRPA